MQEKDPFSAFADPVDDEFSQFADPVGGPDEYLSELQRQFDAGASREALLALAQERNIPADAMGNLDTALEARRQGRRVVFTPDQQEIAPASLGQRFAMGVGDVVEGLVSIPAMVGNAANSLINMTGAPKALLGYDLSTDIAGDVRGMTGLPKAVTDDERMTAAISEGGASAMSGAGLARLASAAPGMSGYVAREVAANPGKDVVAGVAAGAGAEAGDRIGGTAGALAGGLAAGVGGYAGARRLEKLADDFAQRIPKAVAVDASGQLTEEGRELAARAGVPAEEVARSYARRRVPAVNPQTGRRNPNAEMPINSRDLDQRSEAIIEEMQRRADDGAIPLNRGDPPPPPRSVFEEAREEDIRLTRGQAEQDFDVQNDENSLRVSATREGNEARAFFAQQQEQINAALQRFRSALIPRSEGGAEVSFETAADRGQVLKDAVRQLRDSGAEGVRQMYREAEAMGGQELTLDTSGVLQAAQDVLMEEAVPETVKRSIAQQMARYGLIGRAEPMNEAGITRVVLDDGSAVSFRGQQQPLSVANAENLRKSVNQLYMSDPTGISQSIKPALDDAVEAAVEQAAGQMGPVGQAYRGARDAFRAQKRTFAAKDIVDNLIAVKKGTETDLLLPEQAIAKVVGGGPNGVSNLRRVRAVLNSQPTVQSRQAWAAIQQQALADIMDGAIIRNSNANGGIMGEVEQISGSKLRTMIFDRYGADKLRVILGDEQFGQLMKLQRVIGAATIPISGTTNPGGTATKLVNFLRSGVMRFSGLGPVVDAGVSLVGKARDLAATRRTLEGITSYEGPQSGAEMDRRAGDFLREYIEAGRANRLMPASLNATAVSGAGSDK